MSTVETGRGVEGWPIHGRAPMRFDPRLGGLDFVKIADYDATREAAALLEAANRVVGLTDISDSTVRRIAEYLHRDDT
jgi:hypothetical protein